MWGMFWCTFLDPGRGRLVLYKSVTVRNKVGKERLFLASLVEENKGLGIETTIPAPKSRNLLPEKGMKMFELRLLMCLTFLFN